MQIRKETRPPCVMISLRDVRVAGTAGDVIYIEANKPTPVPASLIDLAASLGCVPADAAEYEAHKVSLASTVQAENERKELLIAAVDRLVQRNDITDFAPNGQPKIPALAKESGVPEKDITQQLRDHVFSEWSARNRLGAAAAALSSAPKAAAPASEQAPASEPAKSAGSKGAEKR